jgi:hypothetical protein
MSNTQISHAVGPIQSLPPAPGNPEHRELGALAVAIERGVSCLSVESEWRSGLLQEARLLRSVCRERPQEDVCQPSVDEAGAFSAELTGSEGVALRHLAGSFEHGAERLPAGSAWRPRLLKEAELLRDAAEDLLSAVPPSRSARIQASGLRLVNGSDRGSAANDGRLSGPESAACGLDRKPRLSVIPGGLSI